MGAEFICCVWRASGVLRVSRDFSILAWHQSGTLGGRDGAAAMKMELCAAWIVSEAFGDRLKFISTVKGGVTKNGNHYNLYTFSKCTGFSPEFGYFSAKLSRMVRVHPVRTMLRSHYIIKEYVFERPIYMYVQRQPWFYLFGINV